VAELRDGAPLSGAAFSSDGRLVVTASEGGRAVVWRWRAGRKVATLRHGGAVLDARFDRSGELVVTAGATSARVWRWREERVDATLPHPTRVLTASFGSDGRVLTGSEDRFRVWSLASTPNVDVLLPRPVRGGSRVPIFDAEFGPADDVVIAATAGRAQVWSLASGEPRDLTLAGDALSVALDPRGARALAASNAGAVLLWTLGTDRPPVVLRDDDAASVFDAAFDSRGGLVVTANANGTAEVYRPATEPEPSPG
jgi:WD40 repeat protein